MIIKLKIIPLIICLFFSSFSLYAKISYKIIDNKDKIVLHCLFQKGKIKILDISLQTSFNFSCVQHREGEYRYEIVAGDGSLLFWSCFDIPNKVYYDYEENGELKGGIYHIDTIEFDIDVPQEFYNKKIKIRRDSGDELISTILILHNQENILVHTVSKSSIVYPFTKLLNSGNPGNRINIVFLGDGYTNITEPFTDLNGNGKWDGDQFVDLKGNGIWDSNEPYSDENGNNKYDKGEPFIDLNNDGIYNSKEQEIFRDDVNNMIEYLFTNSVMGKYRNHVNIYRIDSIFSEQAGADHRYNNPILERNTVLNSYYDKTTERLLVTDYSRVNSIIRSSINEIGTRYYSIVIVNCPKYGGSGGSIAVTYNGKSGYEVMVHEFGHTFPKLADEYYYTDSAYQYYQGSEPSSPNVTKETQRNNIKWNLWIPESTPVPTPTNYTGIGLFEGGMYYEHGLYRPKNLCKMRSLGVPFCSVCDESFIKTFYSTNDMIDISQPPGDTVKLNGTENSIAFSVNLIRPMPNTFSINWYLNDDLQMSHDESLTISRNNLGDLKRVEVSSTDTIILVRNDPQKVLNMKKIWFIRQPASSMQTNNSISSSFQLYQNYPNPFNPSTSINFDIPIKCFVKLKIYDIFGREIETLISNSLNSGNHKVEWNASKYSSGLYVYQIQAGRFNNLKKMVLIR
jgi:hypothetical protein